MAFSKEADITCSVLVGSMIGGTTKDYENGSSWLIVKEWTVSDWGVKIDGIVAFIDDILSKLG